MNCFARIALVLLSLLAFMGSPATAQNRTIFGGMTNVTPYAYGIAVAAPPLVVFSAPAATGVGTITLQYGYTVAGDGTQFNPLNTNAPILVGNSIDQETVTPTAVSCTTPAVYGTCSFTANFANLHGIGESIASGTLGLQEAINKTKVTSSLGGIVMVDAAWATMGGTQAMLSAAFLPSSVSIIDNRNGLQASLSNKASSVTQLAAPTALTTATSTNGMITTATTGGAIPASSTYRLGITYVDVNGGETTLSIDTASTATIASGATSTNTISVSSPAALTGAVGYRVYMTAASGATLTEILYTPTCTLSNISAVLPGTCAIGANATITAIITGTATVPASNGAYATSVSQIGGNPQQFQGSFPPFPAITTVNAAATGTLGVVNFPAGYLNSVGKTIRICGVGFGTTNGTGGTITVASKLFSVPGVTSITPYTTTSATIAGSVITVSFDFCTTWTTATTGTTGTLEAHGHTLFNVAGTVVSSPTQDIIVAVSSTIDLTKQDQLDVTISPTTAGLTAAQLRQLTVELLN